MCGASLGSWESTAWHTRKNQDSDPLSTIPKEEVDKAPWRFMEQIWSFSWGRTYGPVILVGVVQGLAVAAKAAGLGGEPASDGVASHAAAGAS